MKLSAVMDHVTAYRIWQAPFAEKKLAPFWRHNDLAAIGRVLDVGCGPGTNSRPFARTDYLGVDINPAYVASARRRFGDRFLVADVVDGIDTVGAYDCILVNSLLHHVDTAGARRLLASLADRLTAGGHVHILDLVMPERPGLARSLARWDRGDFARPLEGWRSIFSESFDPVVFEPYALGLFGITLWNMVYFKGKRKT